MTIHHRPHVCEYEKTREIKQYNPMILVQAWLVFHGAHSTPTCYCCCKPPCWPVKQQHRHPLSQHPPVCFATAFAALTQPSSSVSATDSPCFPAAAPSPPPSPAMGVSWSSVSECLGDFSDHPPSRYNRVPPSRRVGHSSVSSSRDRAALRQRCVADEKLSMAVASQGAAIAPPPPPLVPDSNAVYNLLEDENEDVCPTCLETYAVDNPKILSKCGHAFHLQCIVAWETRSGSRFCPICAKVMEYVEADQSQAK